MKKEESEPREGRLLSSTKGGVCPPGHKLTGDNGLPERASSHRRWGAFRYSVIGPLLSSPPDPGKLGEAIKALAQRCWKHPLTGEGVTFAPATIEGWYYRCKNAQNDPITSLNRKQRGDSGAQRAFDTPLEEKIKEQYENHPWWTVELHHKNLAASLKKGSPPIRPPSYSTLLRYMRRAGLNKVPRPRINDKGELEGIQAPERHEVALFEASFVNELWSLDFHKGKLRVLAPDGRWL